MVCCSVRVKEPGRRLILVLGREMDTTLDIVVLIVSVSVWRRLESRTFSMYMRVTRATEADPEMKMNQQTS